MSDQTFKNYVLENTDKTQIYRDKASKLAQGVNKVIIVVNPYWPEPYIVAVPSGSVRQYKKTPEVREFVDSQGVDTHRGGDLAYADWYSPGEIEELSLGV